MKSSVYMPIAKPLTSKVRAPRLADIDTKATALKPIIEPLPTVPAHLECHVTPPSVADMMADLFMDLENKKVLEPSAGTGSLLEAMKRNHPLAILQGVEIYHPLYERLNKLGFNVDYADFAEWGQDRGPCFDAVIMNPPFRKVKEHIKTALNLLNPGGSLVALVPVTYQGGNEIYKLPADTFKAAKVYTKIIIINK